MAFRDSLDLEIENKITFSKDFSDGYQHGITSGIELLIKYFPHMENEIVDKLSVIVKDLFNTLEVKRGN
jgi:hypothetical protein